MSVLITAMFTGPDAQEGSINTPRVIEQVDVAVTAVFQTPVAFRAQVSKTPLFQEALHDCLLFLALRMFVSRE